MADQQQAKAAVRETAASAKKAAVAVAQSTRELSDSAGRRTTLAGDRTLLASERTYAAWVRTGLAALASGVGARALLKDVVAVWLAQVTGTVLVIFAGFCLVAAVWRDLRGSPLQPEPDIERIPAWLLVPINGFLLIVVVAVLIGIWAA